MDPVSWGYLAVAAFAANETYQTRQDAKDAANENKKNQSKALASQKQAAKDAGSVTSSAAPASVPEEDDVTIGSKKDARKGRKTSRNSLMAAQTTSTSTGLNI